VETSGKAPTDIELPVLPVVAAVWAKAVGKIPAIITASSTADQLLWNVRINLR
jgi:hypothetical protein